MEGHAVAYSDLEAIRLSFRLRRKKRSDEAPGEETEVPRMAHTDLPTLEEVIAEEVIPKEKMTFADPWPGQRIVFDPEVIRAKGFVRSVQTTLSGVQGYSFYKADGTAQFLRMETLLAQKMARKAQAVRG
ncbi:MAG: hypothetical protein K6B72_08895 [Lachnospiraceae bacterium]|nr:hypothetical protein [Lachnospiraceae bacterium]